jgi:hypothetical protein
MGHKLLISRSWCLPGTMKKSSSKTQSVYRKQNVLVRAVFERAGDARKVLCVAIGHAKRKHVARIRDGNGDVLKGSFPVENNAPASPVPATSGQKIFK